MIDLARVRAILAECEEIAAEIDGEALIDLPSDKTNGGTKRDKRDRNHKTALNNSLRLLQDRLTLASALVANEYWFGRGEGDALDPDREEDPE